MKTATRNGVVVGHCKTAEDLLAALEPSSRLWRAERWRWAFRGQPDATRPLVPSLLRDGRWLEFVDDYSPIANVLIAEFHSILEFCGQADRHGLSLPAFDLRGTFPQYGEDLERISGLTDDATRTEILARVPPQRAHANFALAQHYGVPTRFLDWTWKPLVAAYFAAKGAAARQTKGSLGKLAVFALNLDALRDLQVRRLALKVPEIRVVQAPQASIPNLAAQAGLFTFAPFVTDDRDLFDLLRDLLARRGSQTALFTRGHKPIVAIKVTMPWVEAGALLRLLAEEHVSAASVFPGYAGVVESLRETGLWSKRDGYMSGWLK